MAARVPYPQYDVVLGDRSDVDEDYNDDEQGSVDDSDEDGFRIDTHHSMLHLDSVKLLELIISLTAATVDLSSLDREDTEDDPGLQFEDLKGQASTTYNLQTKMGFISHEEEKYKDRTDQYNAIRLKDIDICKMVKLTDKKIPILAKYKNHWATKVIIREWTKGKCACTHQHGDLDRASFRNLGDQVQSLEKQLQETKDNSAKLPASKELILENKHPKKEFEYYLGRACYALYGKDSHWAIRNGYCLSDIPTSDREDNNEDLASLPTLPEEIPQDIPSCPPTRLACPASKTIWNDSKVVCEAGIPAIVGSHLPMKQKRIIADPPTSITGPLGKVRAEQWDQPALRGASEWVMESDIYDSEMCRLYIEGKAMQPHKQSPYHTAAMFCINKYVRLLPGLPKNLVAHHDNPDWMTEVVQSFNANPSGIPRNLQLEVYIVEEPMDQDEADPEPTLSQPTAGSSSLADRLDYGEEDFFSCPPVDAQELQEHISYFDSLVP
ncbi:hypothetical protein M422DRAFT_267362 [Sphaerobolus stellatus SS14]|uniref:Unplaced genomic scaffold SPHSTscaffold_174, whole genome shotgun sequence n=1 Tax=Sphaerobolus stellatus (strain SS14) TaxID=990650 RepID=A0A0C9V081_SPHS4|nr:hypothetical protein M422DRAFT_267362 [Sphaerobolus stellatus SS14]